MRLTKDQIGSSDEARFWSKVDIQEGPVQPGELGPCWPWVDSSEGQHKTISSHRFSFILAGGVLSKSKPWVLHKCDNPSCVNPDHLFAGTRKDNILDAMSRGRIQSGDCHWSRRLPDRVTQGEKHGRSRLTETEVYEIRLLAGRLGQRELSRQYGVGQATIWRIVNRESWRCVP
jgi:hypothetical protein